MFSNDDIAGHVFFNLNNIMGLREVVAGGFGNVPQETRNIFHPKPEGQYFEGKKKKLFAIELSLFYAVAMACTVVFYGFQTA